MGLHVTRSPFSIANILQRRLTLGIVSLLLIVTSLIVFHAFKAHADIANYGQEATGYGNRKVIRSNETFALDSAGNMFASADIGNNDFIRKYAADGSFIKDFRVSDVTGTYTVSYIAKYGRMAVDKNGNLYAINKTDSTIHVFDNNGRYLSTISGAIANADIAFDSANNYYLTDSANNRIRKFAHDGTFLYDIGSTGTGDGQFNSPREIAIDSHDNVIVTDIGNGRIQTFSATGSFIRKFGQTNTGFLCPAQPSLDDMAGLALDQSDNIYVATHAGWCSNNVQKFTNAGTFVATQVRPHPTSYMRLGPDNTIYENEPGQNANYDSISHYATDGTAIGGPLVGDPSVLLEPVASAQDSAGNTYVADQSGLNVHKFDSNHNQVLTFGSGSGFQLVSGIAVDQSNTIYVSDRVTKKIYKFASDGTSLGNFSVSSSRDGTYFYGGPTKIAVRPDGNLAISYGYPYTNQASVQIMTPTGSVVKEVLPADGLLSFAQKDDGSFVILSARSTYPYDDYLMQYDVNGNFISNLPYTNFKLNADIAYDHLGNLYAVGHDPLRPQQYAGSIARLNFTTPEFPTYSVVVPVANDESTMYFTTSNQLLVSDYPQNYVHAYDATILTPPSIPTNLTAVSATPGALALTWQAPVSGPLPSQYRIEYSPHSTGQWYRYSSTTTTNLTLTGLLDDAYDIRVSALNEAGAGPAAQLTNQTVSNTYGFKQRLNTLDGGYIQGISFSSDGRRFESDTFNSRINVYDASGALSYSFGSYGSGDGQFNTPQQGAISSDNKLYVPDEYNNRVEVFALDGTFLSSFGSYGAGDGQMSSPTQVVIDKNDTVYVVSSYGNIQKYDKNGNYLGRIAADLTSPTSMTIDVNGNFYIANYATDSTHGIYKYNAAGDTQLLHFSSYGSGDGQTYDVYGMLVNQAGELVINDPFNYRFLRFTPDGTFLDSIGGTWGNTGDYLTFDSPYTIAQAPNGDLYVPNSSSPYIQVFNITTHQLPTTTPPTAPSAVSANSATPNQINVSWGVPASNGGNPVTSYKVEHKLSSQDASAWLATIVDAAARSTTIPNLAADCYDIRVSAGNSDGYGVPALRNCVQVNNSSNSPIPTPPALTPPVSSSEKPSSPTTSRQGAYKSESAISPASTTLSQPTVPSTNQSTAPVVSAKPVAGSAKPGVVTVTWQAPADYTPTSYVIEYRDAAIQDTDTTTPWRHLASAQPDKTSATVHLPAGNYAVRVAAFRPGDAAHVILGVAHITVSAASFSAGSSTHLSSSDWLLPIKVCIAFFSLALPGFILFIIWKRKRRKQAATISSQLRR